MDAKTRKADGIARRKQIYEEFLKFGKSGRQFALHKGMTAARMWQILTKAKEENPDLVKAS